MFSEMLPMSVEAYQRMELHLAKTAVGPDEPAQLYRHNNRDIQPFGEHRTLYFSSSGDAESPTGVGHEHHHEHHEHGYGSEE